MAADFHNGMSIADIAQKVDRRPCLVRTLLEEAGVVAYDHPACLGPDIGKVAERLARRHRNGESGNAIARRTGIDRGKVHHLIRSVSEPPSPPSPPPVATSAVVAAYSRGLSIRDVAAECGLPYGATRQQLLDAGVALRNRRGREVTSPIAGTDPHRRTVPPVHDSGTTAFVLVAALLPDEHGRVLAIRLPPDQRPFGPEHWYLPGGKVLRGETPREAVTRKLRTELGLDSRDPVELALTAWTRARRSDTDPRATMLFRFAPIPDPDVTLGRLVLVAGKVGEAAWLNPAQIPRLLHPLQAAQLRAVRQGAHYLEQTLLTPPPDKSPTHLARQ
ncbi:NUDIX hydrolase [Saccharothrix sp.]|uniref:NUDIX hydrolase n=1 Tax=Saccharothrix sp. TaxID=1873460 RepID=UPI002810BD21|nr:NUDIX hydrolase [Saccharothrix sp.]